MGAHIEGEVVVLTDGSAGLGEDAARRTSQNRKTRSLPNRLASRSMTSDDVVNAIREQNVQVSAGQLGAEPSPNKPDFLTSINVRGRLTTPEEFGNIVLKSGQNGQIVHLSDVARIELGSGDYTLHTYFDTRDTTIIGIFLSPGANALGVAKTVYAKFDELSKQFPPGVEYKMAWDPTVFVRESVRTVEHTLIEAVILVVIVVIVFLQTWRASIIPLVAVPVSIHQYPDALWTRTCHWHRGGRCHRGSRKR